MPNFISEDELEICDLLKKERMTLFATIRENVFELTLDLAIHHSKWAA